MRKQGLMITVDEIEVGSQVVAAKAHSQDLADIISASGKYNVKHWRPKAGRIATLAENTIEGLKAVTINNFKMVAKIAEERFAFMDLLCDEAFENTVTTEGRNALLNNALRGSSYTAACYFGLISSTSYSSAPAAGDTLASHSNWLEAGSANAPTFSARVAATLGTPSGGSCATSSSSNFTMTGAGTVVGAFMVFNGATSTIANTTGTLYSAGAFTYNKVVVQNDIIQLSYSTSLT